VDAVLRPRSQVVLLPFGDVINGESFEDVSLIFENRGVVVHAPAVISLLGLRNWGMDYSPDGMDILAVVTVTVPPDTIAALSIIQSVPDVPKLTSIALDPFIILAYPAVPDPVAVADHVPCFAIDPDAAAAHGDAGNVMVANNEPDAAVLAPAGWVPVLISTVLPAGKLVDTCVANALRISVSNLTAISLFVYVSGYVILCMIHLRMHP
jgi:hypothetical protein